MVGPRFPRGLPLSPRAGPSETRPVPKSFFPPTRILMGPGPSDISPRVLAALSRPTLGHLDPEFLVLMDQVKDMLRRVFRTENPLTFPVSAPGSAGMETCFVNLLEPGDKAIVCQNGVFGGRMLENVRRIGAEAILVEDNWGEPVDPAKVEAALDAHPDAKVLAFVHAETSTGVRSDAQALCRLAHSRGVLSIVDVVTSLGGIPVEVDAWKADAVYGGSQKCLSCTPGLSPVTFSERALERVRSRRTPVQSWFLDLSLVLSYWKEGAKRSYHHTAPIHANYALHESLVQLLDEGLEASFARHQAIHERLRDGLEALGFRYLVEPEFRLPQLNAVYLPEGVEEAPLRKLLLETYGLEVGGGLGAFAGKIWRIGTMGSSATAANVDLLLKALEEGL